MGERCRRWMALTPVGSVIATVMCLLGAGVFCFTMYLLASLSILILSRLTHVDPTWPDSLYLTFVGIFVGMACLGAMIVFTGLLSRGYTSYRIYVAKRTLCAVVIGITYVVFLGWSLTLCFMVMISFIFIIFSGMCSTVISTGDTVFLELGLALPNVTFDAELKDCKIETLCKERVEKAGVMSVLATGSSFLVLLSLVHYLMSLAANYAHIRGDEKIQKLLQIQELARMEYNPPSMSLFIQPEEKSTDI